MDTYSLLREVADSWVLLGMFGFFLCAAIWAYLPSQNKAREDASMIPFRDTAKTCDGTCDDCAAKNITETLKGRAHG